MAHYGHGSLWPWLTMTGRAPNVAARARVHSVRRALAHRGRLRPWLRPRAGCNPTHPSLQPHAPQPATRCTPVCSPTHASLQPDAPQPATRCTPACNPTRPSHRRCPAPSSISLLSSAASSPACRAPSWRGQASSGLACCSFSPRCPSGKRSRRLRALLMALHDVVHMVHGT